MNQNNKRRNHDVDDPRQKPQSPSSTMKASKKRLFIRDSISEHGEILPLTSLRFVAAFYVFIFPLGEIDGWLPRKNLPIRELFKQSRQAFFSTAWRICVAPLSAGRP